MSFKILKIKNICCLEVKSWQVLPTIKKVYLDGKPPYAGEGTVYTAHIGESEFIKTDSIKKYDEDATWISYSMIRVLTRYYTSLWCSKWYPIHLQMTVKMQPQFKHRFKKSIFLNIEFQKHANEDVKCVCDSFTSSRYNGMSILRVYWAHKLN